MIDEEDLQVFTYSDIKNSQMKDIVNTLKNHNLRHCLVIDNQQSIRGIISSADIARKLHIAIVINDKAFFSKLFDVIHS